MDYDFINDRAARGDKEQAGVERSNTAPPARDQGRRAGCSGLPRLAEHTQAKRPRSRLAGPDRRQ